MLIMPQASQLDRLLGMMRRADAFIETDRRVELRLQLGVIDDVVMRERLLDHHQIEFVKLLAAAPRRQAYRRSWRRPSAGSQGKRSRTWRTTSTSQPGLIFILMRW